MHAGDAPAWRERDEDITAKRLSEYANAGDRHAILVFGQVGSYLGEGISILADILAPERIVIGSIFVRCRNLIEPSMREAICRETLSQIAEPLEIVPAETGEAIGDFAAVMVAVYGLEDN